MVLWYKDFSESPLVLGAHAYNLCFKWLITCSILMIPIGQKYIPNLTSEILLNGSPELHSDLNVQIVKAVHSYILTTKRAL
jgi:hypothetical protein